MVLSLNLVCYDVARSSHARRMLVACTCTCGLHDPGKFL